MISLAFYRVLLLVFWICYWKAMRWFTGGNSLLNFIVIHTVVRAWLVHLDFQNILWILLHSIKLFSSTFRTIQRVDSQRDDDADHLELFERIVDSLTVIRSKLFDFLVSNQAKYVPDNFTNTDAAFINKRKWFFFLFFFINVFHSFLLDRIMHGSHCLGPLC